MPSKNIATHAPYTRIGVVSFDDMETAFWETSRPNTEHPVFDDAQTSGVCGLKPPVGIDAPVSATQGVVGVASKGDDARC